MRTVIATIFKYLAWALFIIVALLYLDAFELKLKAAVILGGVVLIDALIGVTKFFASLNDRRKKRTAEKKLREQIAAERADERKQAVAEKAAAIKDAAQNAGAAVSEGASNALHTVGDKFRQLGTTIRNGLAAADELDAPSDDN